MADLFNSNDDWFDTVLSGAPVTPAPQTSFVNTVAPTPYTPGQPGSFQPGAPNDPNKSKNAGDAAALIREYQASHPAGSASLDDLVAFLKANGVADAGRFMYGSTPSGNEITVGGTKYKVLSGEGSNQSWYTAGTDDSGPSSQVPTPGTTPEFSYAPFAEAFQAPEWTGGPFVAPGGVDDSNSPGYTARLKAGQQALERGAAARGTLLTGGTAKQLERYGQDYAANEYANVYNRELGQYQQQYGQFMDSYNQAAQQYAQKYGIYQGNFGNALAGAGFNLGAQNQGFNQGLAANNQANQNAYLGLYGQNQNYNQNLGLAQFGANQGNFLDTLNYNYATLFGNGGQNAANNTGSFNTDAANAAAAGRIASGNAWSGAISNIGNSALDQYYRRNFPTAMQGQTKY